MLRLRKKKKDDVSEGERIDDSRDMKELILKLSKEVRMLSDRFSSRIDALEEQFSGSEKRIIDKMTKVFDKHISSEVSRMKNDMTKEIENKIGDLRSELSTDMDEMNQKINEISGNDSYVKKQDDIALNIVVRNLSFNTSENIHKKMTDLTQKVLQLPEVSYVRVERKEAMSARQYTSKRVHAHHHAISCDMCGNWQHRKCGSTGITVKQYKAAVAAGSDLAFICAPCELKIPPVDDDHDSVTDDEIQMDLEQDSEQHTRSTDNLERSTNTDDVEMQESMAVNNESVRIDVSFAEPNVIVERSILDPPPTATLIDDRPVEFELIPGGTQRGKDLLVDSRGYSYNVKDMFKSARTITEEVSDGVTGITNVEPFNKRYRKDLRPEDPKNLDFEVVREPFTQLLSIHAFVRPGDCSKQVPLVYIFMSRRSTADYVKVLQAVGRMLKGQCVVEGFVVDYEQALWKAVRL
ncbi:uncharacterized protein LOC123531710 isoform X2 [Mercenaria mercenaria]|uniref:uncharacterized protein LOC123531710 isoform X2 n=1 Tax=Mercenaria mercenaria TaxID=6596 RepID=UPI00234E82E2|nr:uncharacterized protein LOC123531710 isoform X2 [Mercenaria mercenaria]